MNQNTKQLLESVGYDYPEQATLAQKLVVALASQVATMAANNNELKTSEAVMQKFLRDDPVLEPVATPAVSATVLADDQELP